MKKSLVSRFWTVFEWTIAIIVVLLAGIVFASFLGPKLHAEEDNEKPCGGKERWAVKVLDDSAAKDVKKIPKEVTVHQLVHMKLNKLKQGHDVPRQAFEKQVYMITATLEKYKHEADADLHIIAIDTKTKETMIIESPDPSCPDAKHSGYSATYENVRKEIKSFTLKSKKSGWSTFKPGQYKITGVLFQDFIHGQAGVAPNGLELHPILDIQKLQ